MPSITLSEEVEQVSNRYLPQFENNLSKFIRETILYYDRQQTRDKKDYLANLQLIGTMMISVSFILLSVSIIVDKIAILVPYVMFASGVILFAYIIMSIKNKKEK